MVLISYHEDRDKNYCDEFEFILLSTLRSKSSTAWTGNGCARELISTLYNNIGTTAYAVDRKRLLHYESEDIQSHETIE